MTLYSVALFVHVVGAVLLFAALTVEGVAIRLSAGGLVRLNQAIGPLSAVAILIPGFYMTATSWGPAAWIVAGLASWLLIAVAGAVSGIRLVRGPGVPGRFQAASWWVRCGLALGAVFLMTVKPGPLGSAITVAAAAALGAAASVPAWRGQPAGGHPAPAKTA